MTPADRLRALLERPGILVMPGCHDAMSARLIQEAGFELGFMSGFAVSVARLGMPDTGLISYAELADQGQNICRAVSIPLIGDGDTGFGSAQNIKRTVQGYERAGFAAIMLEDQTIVRISGVPWVNGRRLIGLGHPDRPSASPTDVDRRFADLGLGLVDGSIVALAESLDIRRLATRDVRHFAAVRLRDGRTFDLVVQPTAPGQS